MRRHASLFALAIAACLRAPGYVCEDDGQCVRKQDGACISGACAYPDPRCDGGMRWDELAPDDLARACVDAMGSGSGDDGAPPEVLCGNGMIDGLEDCDDGEAQGMGSCPALCAQSGTMLWQVTWDGPAHSEDKAYGLAIDDASASFYLAGFVTEDTAEGQDILLQKRWIEDGSLQWSRTARGDGHGNDNGENVAIDQDGNPVLAAIAINEATDGDLFLRKYDPDGNELWSFVHDEQAQFDRMQGVAVTSTNTIVAVGNVSVVRDDSTIDSEVWMQRFDGSGTPIGTPLVRGDVGLGDEAVDADGDADGVLVTGRVAHESGVLGLWTARYDRELVLRWEDVEIADPIGDETRGVGMGLDPMGGSATAGVLSNDIWVHRYDAFGVHGWMFTLDGPKMIHDEAADVAFAADGSFVVVGFTDFATDGFASADCWIRVFEPDGTERWTDTYDGPAHEIDKVLAVVVDARGSAIMAGYHTVPGQARDVWMRRYAM